MAKYQVIASTILRIAGLAIDALMYRGRHW
jgi:hypothetical protein